MEQRSASTPGPVPGNPLARVVCLRVASFMGFQIQFTQAHPPCLGPRRTNWKTLKWTHPQIQALLGSNLVGHIHSSDAYCWRGGIPTIDNDPRRTGSG